MRGHEHGTGEGAASILRWGAAAIVTLAGVFAVFFTVSYSARLIEGTRFGAPFFFAALDPSGVIVSLVIFFSVLVAAGWLLLSTPSKKTRSPAVNSSLEILEPRYLKGEMAKEQLDEMSKDMAN